jgi:hypothetical protein
MLSYTDIVKKGLLLSTTDKKKLETGRVKLPIVRSLNSVNTSDKCVNNEHFIKSGVDHDNIMRKLLSNIVGKTEESDQKLCIGLDINVCTNTHNENKSDFYIPGCIEALNTLKAQGHTLILVTYCDSDHVMEIYNVINTTNSSLFDETYYVKKNSYKHNIAVYCGLDVMIDEQKDILDDMLTVHKIHFTTKSVKNTHKKNKLFTVKKWADILDVLDTLKTKNNIPYLNLNIQELLYTNTVNKVNPHGT